MDAPRPTHRHFSHHHPLELTISSIGDATSTVNANCSGCTFKIVADRDYYSCWPCSFFLHSACFKMPPSLLHPADPDHHLTLTLLHHQHPAATSQCRACALPMGTGFSYHCQNCHVHYHSLCIFRPISKTQSSLHEHTLSLRFSSPYGAGNGFLCDVCRNPGLPEQWLYCCEPCGFDSHVVCPAAPAPPPTTTSRAPLSSPGNPPEPAPAPAGYPPIGYGGATTGITNVQQQQQMMAVGQTQQQFGGAVVNHPVPGQQPPPPAVVGGGYPVGYGYNNNMQPQPQQVMMMGGGGQMGMGGLIMTSAVAGGAQGVAGGLVETAFNGGFGGDESSSTNHYF